MNWWHYTLPLLPTYIMCAERVGRASRRRLRSFLRRKLVFFLGIITISIDGCCDQLVAALLVMSSLYFLDGGWTIWRGYGLVGTRGGILTVDRLDWMGNNQTTYVLRLYNNECLVTCGRCKILSNHRGCGQWGGSGAVYLVPLCVTYHIHNSLCMHPSWYAEAVHLCMLDTYKIIYLYKTS